MSARIDLLAETVERLERAREHLESTHEGLSALFPLTVDRLQSLDAPKLERLDAYAVRYARLQDLLAPAMRALGRAQLEPRADGEFLGLLALMQRQGVVGETDAWERQRSLGNAVAHEYPHPEQVVDILNGIRSAAPEILGYAEALAAGAAEVLASR